MPAGQLAKDIEKMSDKAIASFAFTQLKKIFPHASDPVPVPIYFKSNFYRFCFETCYYSTSHHFQNTHPNDLKFF